MININAFYSMNSALLKAQNNTKTTSPSFCGNSSEKLITKILNSNNPKEIKITFDEICRIYNHLGYDVTLKRGSHAIVRVNKTNVPIVIPHKDKYVHPNDIKRLKLIMNGEEKKAQLL